MPIGQTRLIIETRPREITTEIRRWAEHLLRVLYETGRPSLTQVDTRFW
jgi:hypothetical protein